jgi:two-component system chemotaxis sensor kinase CheA
MLEIYIHETMTLIDQLEAEIIKTEMNQEIKSSIDEIFRIMHTIKGNSMMMEYNDIGQLAHEVEDLFDFLRNKKFRLDDYTQIINLVLGSIDYFKFELEKIQNNQEDDLEPAEDILLEIENYLDSLKDVVSHRKVVEKKKERDLMDIDPKNLLYINVRFKEDCQMEEVRAFAIIYEFEAVAIDIVGFPDDLENSVSRDIIKENGFTILINTEEPKLFFEESLKKNYLVSKYEIQEVDVDLFQKIHLNDGNIDIDKAKKNKKQKSVDEPDSQVRKQKFINVKVDYLDSLLNLIGEIVISESMVSRNQDIEGLKLDNFNKAVHQLRKIIEEIQDVVMEIRMVPLTMTFQKMNRIVRDITSKTGKKVTFDLMGENTQVDKNIIENISDPLMHLVRNAVDHGIESEMERYEKGKNPEGHVTLSAKKSGGDIYVTVEDDGKGLDPHKIYKKAFEKGLLTESFDTYTNKQIFEIIFESGFSTNEEVTGFSGRGVGLDVVKNDIKKIGGSISIHTDIDKGTTFRIKIPMTLAIIDGMILRIGNQKFILPVSSIQETFSPTVENLAKDGEKDLMIIRGEAIRLLNLSTVFDIKSDVENFVDGIVVVVEMDDRKVCVFVDEIIGEHQVVVKNFNNYIRKIVGLSGTALLGNGEISLIIDPSELLNE